MNRSFLQVRVSAVAMLAAVLLAAAAASGCGGSDGAAGQSAADVAGGGSGGTTATTLPAGGGSAGAGAGSGGEATEAPSPSPKPAATPATPALRVIFVDVGQGDAAVLRSGAWTGLVDGGPSGSEAAVGAALRKLGVRRLDTLVISHLHADHTGGLPALVRQFQPRRAWVAGKAAGSLAAALRGAGTRLVQARRGLTARFGRAKASVLAPGGLSGDANTDSIVLLLQAGGRRVVFTGDSTASGEVTAGASLARGPPVDVLKVSHHGSRSSTTASFVDAARPRTSVISVGSNSYGHPTNEVVQRLRRAGARVFTTQKNGTVTLTITSRGALRWSFADSPAPLLRGISGGSSSSSSGSSGGSGAAGAASAASGGSRVFVTETGECYHRSDCRYLASSKIAMTLARAKAQGYRPCSVCDPPR